ncbi:MAG: hypothetical protein AAGI68_04315 [Planctomycetota bacterium]
MRPNPAIPRPGLFALIALPVLLGCFVAPALAQAEPRTGQGPAFFAPSTTLHGPQSAILPFQVPHAHATRDRNFRVRVSGPLQVLSPPEVLAGHTTGFIRVRPRPGLNKPAQASLRVEDATLLVHLQPAPADPASSDAAPAIRTPVQGAAVWGKVAIAVEWPLDPDQPHLRTADPILRLQPGTTLQPHHVGILQDAPYRQAVFLLDTKRFSPGILRLTPVLTHGQGQAQRTTGKPVTIRVVRPDKSRLVQREAETPDPRDNPLPNPLRQGPINITDDPSASGGAFVAQNGARPIQTHPLEIESPGWYQLIVRARGTPHAGALPAIGFRVDDIRRPLTQGWIAHTQWHRAAIGRPVYLKPSHRTLIPKFENDSNYGKNNDRNLYLDRIELLRLEAPPDTNLLSDSHPPAHRPTPAQPHPRRHSDRP